MPPPRPDRQILQEQLRAAVAERGATAPGAAEVALLHRLGEAYGCHAPRDLERASTLYEQALQLLWEAEGQTSLRAIPVLASWLDCARARLLRLTGADRQALDQEAQRMRQRAEALLAVAEPRVLSGDRALFGGVYTLLERLGEEERAMKALHACSPNWAPRR